MDFRVRLQLAEAFGPLNRWFCSQAYGRKIVDPELLLAYYIRNGGAEDFANRYAQAIGPQNRWYCSEFYRRDVRDPETLWNYYNRYGAAAAVEQDPRHDPQSTQAQLSFAS